MSPPDTQFNPFGRQVTAMQSVREEMTEIAEKNDFKMDDFVRIVKVYERICEDLTEIAKDSTVPAMQPLLSDISLPLSKFILILNKKTPEDLKILNINVITRKISKFMQTVADRISEPFNSEDLKEWCPLIKSLLTSKQLNLRESGAQLWKKSFGTVKTQLTYPDDLRTILQKMPKKFGIVVPPAARLDSTSFLVDDDAMDGLSDSSESSMLMNLETNKMQNDLGGNQCSFQFSQQGPADDVADKLLKEKSVRTCTPSRNPVSHDKNSSRKRAAKISLLDEDSCDFVKIASTPPSCRKTRLTDRQKEKLAEASVPNTSINYMGEESQSGLQKTENIKKALTAMNFDVGEDSISTQFSIALQKTTADATDIEKEESAQSCRKSSKRSRKLFNVTPVKAFPDVSSYNSGSCNSVDEKKEAVNDTVVTDCSSLSPLVKRGKSVEETSEVSVDVNNDDSNALTSVSENIDGIKKTEMTQFLPPRKQNGRPKKASITDKIQAIPTEATQSRRSLRLSVAGKVSPTEPTESTDSIGDDDLSLNNSNASRTENKEIVFPRTSEPTRDLESSFAETSSKEYSTKTCAKSPATPKTPSILKNSKETEGTESPATERKKNRVHFGAESLPCESFSSPATIRRKTILERTPPIKKVSSTSNTDRSPENRSSPVPLTAFFPALIDCQEKIERIIPNLVTLCKKTVLDSAKRSLHAVGVRTVGDFAQLPRSQIEKFTWIKGRSSGARNALSQYERNWNSVKGTAECSRNQIKIDSEDVKDSVTSVSSENNLSVLEKTNSIQTESDTINTSDTPHNTSNVQNTSEQITFKFVNPENELTILNQDNSLTGSLPISTTPRKSLESSQSPASTLSNTVAFSSSTNGSSSPPITPEGKPVVTVRKNLAALFSENAKTQKMATDNVKENEVSFLQDSRLLQGICAKLSRAHWTKQLQTVNSVKIISIISQAAMFFKTVVQTRGGIEWDRIDNNKLSDLDHDFSVEEEVDELFGVFTRFARHHNHPVADSLPWSRVLYSLSNAAAVLEVICISLTTPT